MLSRLESWAQLLAWGAVSVLAVAAALTVADIVLRGAARTVAFLTGEPLSLGLVGVVDLVQLCVLTAAWLSIPWAFATGGHVAVELLHQCLPRAAREGSAAVAAAAACVFLSFTLRYCVEQAQAVATWGDRSATLQIPLVWYWLPLLFGLGLSVLMTAGETLVRAGRFLRAFGRN